MEPRLGAGVFNHEVGCLLVLLCVLLEGLPVCKVEEALQLRNNILPKEEVLPHQHGALALYVAKGVLSCAFEQVVPTCSQLSQVRDVDRAFLL